jgi:hypothetical protein
MMTYCPKSKGSLGRPLKRWRDAITGHWGLIRVRRKKKKKKNTNIMRKHSVCSKSDTGCLKMGIIYIPC